MYEPHNVQAKVDRSMRDFKKNGNNHGTFTTKVVRSVFILATRGHDILYSDWGDKILHRSVHHVDPYFRVLCTTVHVLLSYHKLSLFNYCL